MSFELDVQEALPEAIRRMARELIEASIQDLRSPKEGQDKAVHTARKSMKKVRALLRLVRDELGKSSYKSENVYFRDTARLLRDWRESDVLFDVYQDLTDLSANTTPSFEKLKTRLQERQKDIRFQAVKHNQMDAVVTRLQASLERVNTLDISDNGFDTIKGGLKRVYKRGYNALQKAEKEPSPENLHDWRKRVKYLWYHFRILRQIWPPVMDGWISSLDELSDLLGIDHDLYDLQRLMQGFNGPEASDWLDAHQKILRSRHTEYRTAALVLGRKNYVEKPSTFVSRIESYYSIWKSQ